MEHIKLIGAPHRGLAVPELEGEANQWLKQNTDKDIIDISLTSYPNEPGLGPELGRGGWIILIRYREE